MTALTEQNPTDLVTEKSADHKESQTKSNWPNCGDGPLGIQITGYKGDHDVGLHLRLRKGGFAYCQTDSTRVEPRKSATSCLRSN